LEKFAIDFHVFVLLKSNFISNLTLRSERSTLKGLSSWLSGSN